MTFMGLLEYIEDNRIRIIAKPDGVPAFAPPEGKTNQWLAEKVAYCSHVIVKYREELVIHYQRLGVLPQGPLSKPLIGGKSRKPNTIYPDTPLPEQRRILIERAREIVRSHALLIDSPHEKHLACMSDYTRETWWIGEDDPVESHVTYLGIVYTDMIHPGQHRIAWKRLPGHSPPLFTVKRKNKPPTQAYWKAPVGWKPPKDWIKPKGFKWKKKGASGSNSARSRWYKEHYTYKENQLPD